MLEDTPAFARHRFTPPPRRRLPGGGMWLASGWLCALIQINLATQTAVTVAASDRVVLPAAAPAQTNGVAQADAGTTNTLGQIIANDPAFRRFTNLVEHSLFAPTSASSTQAADTGLAAFAASLRLTGFFKNGTNVQASIENRNEPDKKFFVRLGDTIGDTEIKVVDFDLPGRAVLLAKGQEQGRLEYESEAAPAPAMLQLPGGPQRPGTSPGPRGVMTQPPPPPQAAAGAATDSASMRMTRAQSRRQTIERLRAMLQTTTDPAAQQRLQSYIQLLERANTQEQ